MKLAAILLAIGLSSATSTFGQSINLEGLGQSLNGWNKNRTATYTIDNRTYRTHVPTVTPNLDGGVFLSTRIDHLGGLRPDAVCYLELTFTPQGYVGSSQIRITMNGQKLNTGQVLRERSPESGEEGAVGSADWRSSHMKMVLDLFAKLDTEFGKMEEKEKSGKRDLWGRFNGSQLDTADLSAALRHNLNLILAHVS